MNDREKRIRTTDDKPLVSIGMPVYNGDRFIRQALEPLLTQDYENFELIISDNASTDRTQEICREYAARDGRIRYFRNESDLGARWNFKRVFDLSTGEYFMWTAADDVRPSNAVRDCVEALQRIPRAVMAHGKILLKIEGREGLVEVCNEMNTSSPKAAERVRAFIKGIRHTAMVYGLYRRSALAKALPVGNHYAPDYLICLQMCLVGPMVHVNTPMLIYRHKEGRPIDRPMSQNLPITVRNLRRINRIRRIKCWTVLLMGCYYLARIQGAGLTQRPGAIAAHVWTFGWVYREKLAKELVFQLSNCVARIVPSFLQVLARKLYRGIEKRSADTV